MWVSQSLEGRPSSDFTYRWTRSLDGVWFRCLKFEKRKKKNFIFAKTWTPMEMEYKKTTKSANASRPHERQTVMWNICWEKMQGQHSLSRYLKTTWMLRCCSVCNQLCYHPAAAQQALGKEHTTPPPPTFLKYCWAMNSTSSVCLSPLLLISFCWLSPPLCVFVGAQTLVWNFWRSCTAGFRHTFPITDYAACGTILWRMRIVYISIYPKI